MADATWDLVSTTVLTGSASTVTLTGLTGYKSFHITAQPKTLSFADPWLRLNGASGTHETTGFGGGSSLTQWQGSDDKSNFSKAALESSGTVQWDIDIIGADRTIDQALLIRSGKAASGSGGGSQLSCAAIRSASTLTSIQFGLFSSSYATGSIFTVYGLL